MADEGLSNNVQAARKQQGLTQADLAKRIGVSRQSINYIEAGTIAPSVALALRLSKELNKPVEELFSIRG